jgi:hypothetical protein
MNASFLGLEIKNIPPVKHGSVSNTVKYLDKWRTEASKLMLQYCAKCDDFMNCTKVSCEVINDKINNMILKDK